MSDKLKRWHGWVAFSQRADEIAFSQVPASVLWWLFPAMVLGLAAVAVACGINGWSTGAWYPQIAHGSDPALLFGTPREIRTDEWNVQSVWAITQVQLGLPVTNLSFPGGMDATLPQDLPRVDPSLIFRPHLWGFPILPLAQAFAFKWWMLVVSLVVSVYWLALSIMPRRPLTAAVVAVAFYFSPLVQWWFLATTIYPLVWAALTVVALIWAIRSTAAWQRWLWAAGSGYAAVVMAMGIYVPFIVPAAIAVFGIAIALLIWLLTRRPRAGWRELLSRIAPVVTMNGAAGIVVIVWLAAKWSVVSAFLNTAYPGKRVAETGQAGIEFLAQSIASSFAGALQVSGFGLLGPNQSEASSFFYIGLFLTPVIVWMLWLSRRTRSLNWWLAVGSLGSAAVLLAFLFVPGWSGLAHYLLLDLTTIGRVRLGLGFLSLTLLLALFALFDSGLPAASRRFAAIVAGVFLASQLAIGFVAWDRQPEIFGALRLWPVWVVLGGLTIYLAARARILWSAVLFAFITFAAAGRVNPVYIGVVDLRQTELSHQIETINAAAPGLWVGVGGRLSTALLLESGVEGLNGFQGAPSRVVWGLIDPSNSFEYQWNRLAGVSWTAGAGEPKVSNPYPDQIEVNFDPCSSFAQRSVSYVLSEGVLDSQCLAEMDRQVFPAGTYVVYRVIAP